MKLESPTSKTGKCMRLQDFSFWSVLCIGRFTKSRCQNPCWKGIRTSPLLRVAKGVEPIPADIESWGSSSLGRQRLTLMIHNPICDYVTANSLQKQKCSQYMNIISRSQRFTATLQICWCKQVHVHSISTDANQAFASVSGFEMRFTQQDHVHKKLICELFLTLEF